MRASPSSYRGVEELVLRTSSRYSWVGHLGETWPSERGREVRSGSRIGEPLARAPLPYRTGDSSCVKESL